MCAAASAGRRAKLSSPSTVSSKRSPPSYSSSPSPSATSPASANSRGETSPSYSSSNTYTAFSRPKASQIGDQMNSREATSASYSSSNTYTAFNRPTASHFQDQYATPTTFKPCQTSSGYSGTKRTVEENTGARQRGTKKPPPPPPSSSSPVSWNCYDSTPGSDDRYTAAGNTRRKKQSQTPAAATTASTDDDYELEEAIAAERCPTDQHHANSSPRNVAASTSRSVGTDEIRTAEAMTTTGDYQLERPLGKNNEMSNRCDEDGQVQQSNAAAAAAAAGSRDHDDVTPEMTNTEYANLPQRM